MSAAEEFRERTRAMWAAGDWDSFSRFIEPVGALVLERIGVGPGVELLDVGTGTGGNVAIPAAQRGASVVGLDVTPELLAQARRRAAEAGVEVRWVEGEAQELPFEDSSFDRVVSTFGAMFAPDHARAASELTRVCRTGGEVAMTAWGTDGFAGELFKLTGAFMPPPAPGVQTPELWGDPAHVEDAFGAAGASATIAHEVVDFPFPSIDEAVSEYESGLGPFVLARRMLEPQGRWQEFRGAFTELLRRFNGASDGSVEIRSEYLLITVAR